MSVAPSASEIVVRLAGSGEASQAEKDIYERCGVEYEPSQWGDYVPKLEAMFRSGTAPDLLLIPTDYFAAFAKQGWLAPIDKSSGLRTMCLSNLP